MITCDCESCLGVRWLINYYFCQSLKKSEISNYYQPVHSSATNESILNKQYSFHDRSVP